MISAAQAEHDKLGNESITFDCSACGALAGEPCTTRGREASLRIGTLGQFAVYPHPERQQLALAARTAGLIPAVVARFVDVVFDGPPSHESGRFVEVEDEHGKSISIGKWIDRGNGLWALRIEVHS